MNNPKENLSTPDTVVGTPVPSGAPKEAAPFNDSKTIKLPAELNDSRTIRFDSAGVPHPPKAQTPPKNPTKHALLNLFSITPDPLGMMRKKEAIETTMFGTAPPLGKIDLSGSPDAIKDLSEQFEYQETFAEGGHAKISSARDLALGRLVAVKWLKEEFASEKPIVENFIAEARLAAQIDHPGLPPVYALGRDAKGHYFLTMKLIRGRTLREYLDHIAINYKAKGVRSFNERASLTMRLEHFLKICDAMCYAHSRNVIHRDLKPENIMIGEFREVYVMDWGIAKVFDPSTTQILERQSVDGTPRYLAPELIDGRPASPLSDVFSLGAILFEITTLSTAVIGSSLKEILGNTRAGHFAPMAHRFPEIAVHGDLKAIIAKAMTVDPAARYQTVDALAEDLRRHLRNEEVTARPDNLERKCVRGAYNHPMTTMSIILCAVLLLGGATITSLYQQKAAAQESKHRELRLTALQAEIAKRAFKVDRLFLHLEDTLTWVASRATRLLENRERAAATFASIPLYSSKGMATPASAPPDTAFSNLYRTAVSIDHPVYKLAGKLGGEPTLDVRALSSIGDDFKQMLLTSDPTLTCGNTPVAELRQRALNVGLPMRWCYIGMPDGAVFIYPGSDTYPAEYDASKRPWYTSAKDRMGCARWGSPYLDVSGQGLVLACAIPIRGADGALLGVAGLDMTFDYIMQNVMSGEESNKAVVEKYIIDEQGRIVISSKAVGKKFEIGMLDNNSLELPRFPQADVLAEIKEGQDGLCETTDHAGPVIYAFAPIHTIGWTYVEKVRLDTLLAGQ